MYPHLNHAELSLSVSAVKSVVEAMSSLLTTSWGIFRVGRVAGVSGSLLARAGVYYTGSFARPVERVLYFLPSVRKRLKWEQGREAHMIYLTTGRRHGGYHTY